MAVGLVLISTLGGISSGAADPAREEARAILESVRLNQRSMHESFTGRLRSGRTTLPFRLVFDGTTIIYDFEAPAEKLVLQLGSDGSALQKGDGGDRVGRDQFLETIGGTDLSYEDVALRFLYWTDAKVVGEELVLARPCIKLELHPPRGAGSQYGTVWAWVEKNSGALLRAEGYRPDGTVLTRFSVISGQKINGQWVLKRMRIERMEDGRPRDKTPTYLEIDSGS